MEELIENIDYVICQICKLKKESLAGPHLKRTHKITTDEYLEMFPGHLVICKKYGEKVSPKGREDHHMKRPEMRKLFSEKIKGINNPNSKENSSDLKRKQVSPYNIEFYKKRFPNNYEEKYNEFLKFNKIKRKEGKPSSNKIEYWLDKGFNEDEAKLKLKERQKTFSLEKCIEKFGKEIGTEKFLERQKKWHQNYTKSSYSKISQELFSFLLNQLSDEDKLKCRFATCLDGKILSKEEQKNKNWEKTIKTNEGCLFPDFVFENKIIEFDGVYYHRNTTENKKRDKIRDERLRKEGYEILHIREDEYKKDKELVLQKCIDFLNESNSKHNELF